MSAHVNRAVRFSTCIAGICLLLLATDIPADASPGKSKRVAVKKSAGVKAKKAALKPFKSCSSLVSYGQRFAPKVRVVPAPAFPPRSIPAAPPVESRALYLPPENRQPLSKQDGVTPTFGTPVAQAAPSAQSTSGEIQTASEPGMEQDSSTTNVQEVGIDEPDTFKIENKRIYTVVHNSLHAVDVSTDQPRLLGSLALDSGGSHQLLVYKGRMLVISRHYQPYGPQAAAEQTGLSAMTPVSAEYGQAITLIREIDVRNPAAMSVRETLTVEGGFVSARLTDSTVRVVVSSRAHQPESQRVRSRIESLVPSAELVDERTGKESERLLVPCRKIARTATFTGLGMLSVLTIDMKQGLPAVDSDAVMTDGSAVYASSRSLYVATSPVSPSQSLATLDKDKAARTTIHRFDAFEPQSTVYRASGQVPGSLHNQFSMSEHKGVLRVASTTDPFQLNSGAMNPSETLVTTLIERDGRLNMVGQVGRLGLRERVYAVRFIDDVGYVVTFRRKDPLYTIDLSDPAKPRVRGELHIPGYSAYLHPVGKDLLLGVGREDSEVQLSLFDTSNLDSPTRLHQWKIGIDPRDGSSSSVAEHDHHAFLYWNPKSLVVLPLQSSEYDENGKGKHFFGAAGFRVGREGIQEVGRISHTGESEAFPRRGQGNISRSLIVGSRIFTLSALGVHASNIDTLADLGHMDYPQIP